jgi:hypothetical protein
MRLLSSVDLSPQSNYYLEDKFIGELFNDLEVSLMGYVLSLIEIELFI